MAGEHNFNAQTRGLLSFLEAFTDGKGPDVLSRQLVPTFDLIPWLAAFNRQRGQFTGVAAGTVNGAWAAPVGFTVFPAQLFVLWHYTIQIAIPIGTTCTITPTVQMPTTSGAGTQQWAVGPPVSATNSTLANVLVAQMDTGPILLPPGSVFGGNTSNLSAATALTASGVYDISLVKF
jgi:hypothetical protein